MHLLNNNLKEDPRIKHLTRLVHWQNLVLALIILVAGIVVVLKTGFVQLPESDPLQEAPPITKNLIQYQLFAYQDGVYVNHGSTIESDRLMVVGQVYDINTVSAAWPDFQMYINDQNVPVPKSSGAWSLDFFLKPGKNVFNSHISVSGQLLNQQQLIIYYQPPGT